ncbi:MAG: FAD-dependent oxidoreductase [Candidatus Diapherotrites archaeon]|nr:FAD-dependent oxidoreductase [Candidatus Diapherotrites archaeon]
MHTLILGGGPAGLTAGLMLSRNNHPVTILEKGKSVGGLAKTIEWNGFKVDFGGHRFFTKNEAVYNLVIELLKDEIVQVKRTSRIYMDGKYYDYPVKPVQALLNLGPLASVQIMLDYVRAHAEKEKKPAVEESFEEWTVKKYGRKMYSIFFKDYTEKVWGIPCNELSSKWAAQRIKGLSLGNIVRNALIPKKKARKTSLIGQFLYPKYGYGRIWERMREEIVKDPSSTVELNACVSKIHHEGSRVTQVELDNGKMRAADQFVSTIPVTELVKSMHPAAPKEVLEAASQLTFRDWIGVNLIIKDRRTLSEDTWLYVHTHKVLFGRIQNWAHWSEDLVPGKDGSIMLEYFCYETDNLWKKTDAELIEFATHELCDVLGLAKRKEVINGFVLRARKTYPVYRLGFDVPLQKLKDYVKTFDNLQIIGRYGTFKYNNADHSIEMGLKAAENLLGKKHDVDQVNTEQEYQEEKEEASTDYEDVESVA